jgi:hypothetical protein
MFFGYIGTVEQIFTHYATITPVTLFYGFFNNFSAYKNIYIIHLYNSTSYLQWHAPHIFTILTIQKNELFFSKCCKPKKKKIKFRQ